MRQTVLLVYKSVDDFEHRFQGEYTKLDREMKKVGATRMEEIPLQKAAGYYSGIVVFVDYDNPTFTME